MTKAQMGTELKRWAPGFRALMQTVSVRALYSKGGRDNHTTEMAPALEDSGFCYWKFSAENSCKYGPYFRNLDVLRSARIFPCVWQVGQYCRAVSANETSRTVSPQTGHASPVRA
jgi:hypothetical protein